MLDDVAKDKPASWIVNTGARVQVNAGPLAHWEPWFKLLDDYVVEDPFSQAPYNFQNTTSDPQAVNQTKE